MIDSEKSQETLKQFDALREDDLIQSRTVDNIEPEYADEIL